jgi:putative addiction module killer protein
MEARPRKLLIHEEENGTSPFQDWLSGLEIAPRATVRAYLNRIRAGNLLRCKPIVGPGGLFELVIDRGPGYRVYFLQEGDEVILLWGGIKKTQASDIVKANRLAEERRG